MLTQSDHNLIALACAGSLLTARHMGEEIIAWVTRAREYACGSVISLSTHVALCSYLSTSL